MGLSSYCVFRRGVSPIVAAAVHHGHDTRSDIEQLLALDEKQRLREEDPLTGEWTQIAETQLIGLRSRFEVDLNRPREKAVYVTPDDAWGLSVWRQPPDSGLIGESLKAYDDFYATVGQLLGELTAEFKHVVVYDLHTYNHRRCGSKSAPADPQLNPEVNIGTGTMDRQYWGPLVEVLIDGLRAYDYFGRTLDVRENVKFRGGHFGRWIHENFPQRVCAIAIEFKKFFMDEWEGTPDRAQVESIYAALRSTLPGMRATLAKM